MGFGGISIWQLLIVLAIVLVLFGTKRIRNLGGDLGGAVKGFKKAMSDGAEDKDADPQKLEKADEKVIQGEAINESAEAAKDQDKDKS